MAQIAIGSLDTPGLGVGPMPDFAAMTNSPLPQAELTPMKTEGLSINLATVRQQYGLKDGVEAW